MDMARAVVDMLRDDYWSEQAEAARTPGGYPSLAASAITEAFDRQAEIGNDRKGRWHGHLMQIKALRPDAVAELTESAVTAACRPVSAGTCRWCVALAEAGMRDEKLTPDAALSQLLGPRCKKCQALVASVASSTATATATTRAGLAVSPALATNHKNCTTCQIGELAAAEAKRTRGAPELAHLVARAKQPHQPLPGMTPTGLYKSRGGQWRLRYSTRTAR
jgi:hypothetical protein